MVKTPRSRHSAKRRQYVTIEHDPKEGSAAGEAESGRPTATARESEIDPKATGGDEGSPGEGAGPDEPGAEGAVPPRDEAAEETAPPASVPDDGRGKQAGEYAAAAAPRRAAGFGALLLAAVIGGVIAVAIAAGLQWEGVLAPLQQANGAAPATEQALDGVRQTVAGLKEDVAALDKRISAAPQGSASADQLRQAVAGLGQRIDGLERKLDRTAKQAGSLAAAAAAGGRAQAGSGQQIKALEARMGDLGKSVAALQKSEPSTGRMDAFDKRLGEAEASAKSASQQASSTAGQIAQLQQAVNGVSGTAQRLSGSLNGLEKTVGDLAQKVAAEAGQPKVAIAIAASALKSAVDRGGRFLTELDTYAAVAPKSPELEQLRDVAKAGAPTQAELSLEAGGAAEAMVAATRKANGDRGFFGNLINGARSLVKINPVGQAKGNTPQAIAARFVAAVRDGDYREALDEYGKLPQAAQAAGKDFVARIRRRIEAEDLVRKVLAQALGAGQTTSTGQANK